MMTKDIENVLMQGSIAELRALYVEKRLQHDARAKPTRNPRHDHRSCEGMSISRRVQSFLVSLVSWDNMLIAMMKELFHRDMM